MDFKIILSNDSHLGHTPKRGRGQSFPITIQNTQRNHFAASILAIRSFAQTIASSTD